MKENAQKGIQRRASFFIGVCFTLTAILPAWGYALTQETFRPSMAEENPGMMKGLKDDLTSTDGGERGVNLAVKIALLEREKRKLAEELPIRREAGNVGLATHLEGAVAAIDTEIERLSVGQEIFPTFKGPLSRIILNQVQAQEAPEVVGFDLAYFAYNPDAYVNYWRHIRRNPTFGKVGSGLVSVLLPYAMREETPLLAGIDSQNIDDAIQALNVFASRHTGEEVDLNPDDFGIVVPPELLSYAGGTHDYVKERTGGHPLTKIFARKEVAEAFKTITSLVAFVFDLPFKEELAGVDALEKALLAKLEEGPDFVNPSINVSEQARNTLLELRNTLAGL
ncbi:MAG: hypothetical protein HY590_07030 [Candidatus Omnitrophica bacterium]|nr:hypothetical protein [Candidatus Omnitrophota bacterium]